jgi:hypothetical protein
MSMYSFPQAAKAAPLWASENGRIQSNKPSSCAMSAISCSRGRLIIEGWQEVGWKCISRPTACLLAYASSHATLSPRKFCHSTTPMTRGLNGGQTGAKMWTKLTMRTSWATVRGNSQVSGVALLAVPVTPWVNKLEEHPSPPPAPHGLPVAPSSSSSSSSCLAAAIFISLLVSVILVVTRRAVAALLGLHEPADMEFGVPWW